jgi:hypothetical protein
MLTQTPKNTMIIEYVPLLPELSRLYALPRDMNRFRSYLKTVVNEAGDDAEYAPLVLANPMAREPVRDLVESYLSIDADGIAERELALISQDFESFRNPIRATLMIVDDLQGGWTNRFATEIWLRRIHDPGTLKPRQQNRFWLTGVLWASEPVTEENVRTAIRAAAYRLQYVFEHGYAATLRSLVRQELAVIRMSGQSQPALSPAEEVWTRQILADRAEADDPATLVAFLFGDEAADSLGFERLGLAPSAGLRLPDTDH